MSKVTTNGRRALRRIVRVESERGLVVRLTFDDGTEKAINLDWYVRGPVFEEIRKDPDVFRAVRVDEELGSLVWPNGADLDTQVLYYDDLYPSEWDEKGLTPVQVMERKRATVVELVQPGGSDNRGGAGGMVARALGASGA